MSCKAAGADDVTHVIFFVGPCCPLSELSPPKKMGTQATTLSSEDKKKLIQGAFEAKQAAYSIYSKFPVGACLLAVDGTLIKGASIDNASYGANICAEQTAIVKAVSDGVRPFTGLAVVGPVSSPISPCGICRQVLREFCSADMPIILVAGNSDPSGVRETTLGQLLPDSFGLDQLGVSSS